VFSQIGRVLLHVDHGTGLNERIVRIALWCVKSDTLVLIESSGKIVSIDDTEDSAVDIQIDAYIQISPGVNLGLLAGNEDLVSLEEDTLRDATVLSSILQNMQSVIIEVIVNSAFANAVVLIGVLYNGLLEIGLEVQHL
jgi:hypothetical protein